MSNSKLVTYTNLTSKHYGERKVKGVTIHCYVGQVTAKQGVDYLTNTPRQASANYVVGRDGSIGLCVEEKYGAFTSSSKKNDYTDGMVTIEVACNPEYPYDITRQAYDALISLVTDICKRNKINKLVWSNNKSDRVNKTNGCNMSMHRDFAATACPGDYIISKLPKIATEVNNRLGTTTTATTTTELYRVRKSWSDSKSQIGAYKILANAKKACKDGYSVFNSKGEVVYTNSTRKSNEEIAKEVISGKWGNGAERKNRITEAGYDYSTIQNIVNNMLK